MPFEPSPVNYQGTFAAPTLTASTTAVMLGLGATTSFALITPQITGRVLVIISGLIQNSVSGDGCNVQLSYGTGTAPVNGAALTGTQIGLQSVWTSLTNAMIAPFCLQALITGLAVPVINANRQTTAATTVWLDLAFKAVTGGNASVTNVNITALEL